MQAATEKLIAQIRSLAARVIAAGSLEAPDILLRASSRSGRRFDVLMDVRARLIVVRQRLGLPKVEAEECPPPDPNCQPPPNPPPGGGGGGG